MIDYRGQLAALDEFTKRLAQVNDPTTNVLRDEHLADLSDAPGMAALGCLIDHLLAHATSDGAELAVLERVSTLWSRGLALNAALSDFRSQLEATMRDPADPAALQKLNAAAVALQPFTVDVLNLLAELEALRAEVRKFEHLPPHPRQRDAPVNDWDWGNYFLARRTDAYTRMVRERAADRPGSAFALGVLSGYGANACGSAYLGQVVGGPRRAHRHRDRVARNSVGSWFAKHHAGAVPLQEIRDRIVAESPAGLPASTVDLIESAMSSTYDPNQRPAPPDLQLGYRRLLRHLELLAKFVMPPKPQPPGDPFLPLLFADPAKPLVNSMPPAAAVIQSGAPGVVGAGGGIRPLSNQGTDDAPSHAEEPGSTEVKCGDFWEAIGLALVFLVGGWFACLVSWGGATNDNRCELWDDFTQSWEAAFPDGAQGAVEISAGGGALTAEGAVNLAQTDQIIQLIGDLFSLHVQLWEGMYRAADYLALYGLLYPDGLLDGRRYAQYLMTPVTAAGSWPLLPETGPRFDEYPLTAVEQPAEDARAYPSGQTPGVIFTGVPEGPVTTAASLSTALWRQMAVGDLDGNNLDLDADRAWSHPCWTADGSIDDQPLAVTVLPYSEG